MHIMDAKLAVHNIEICGQKKNRWKIGSDLERDTTYKSHKIHVAIELSSTFSQESWPPLVIVMISLIMKVASHTILSTFISLFWLSTRQKTHNI